MQQTDRLTEYFLKKGVRNYTDIEQFLEIKRGVISATARRNGNFSTETIVAIVKKCPDLNISWLLTGNGEMLHNKEWNEKYTQEIQLNESESQYGTNWKEKYYELLERYTLLLEQINLLKNTG